MADNERCNVNTGTVTAPRYCGKAADNWCYHTSGPKTHNHNVCDEHWDSKKKACKDLEVPMGAPTSGGQRSSSGQRSPGGARATPPIRPA